MRFYFMIDFYCILRHSNEYFIDLFLKVSTLRYIFNSLYLLCWTIKKNFIVTSLNCYVINIVFLYYIYLSFYLLYFTSSFYDNEMIISVKFYFIRVMFCILFKNGDLQSIPFNIFSNCCRHLFHHDLFHMTVTQGRLSPQNTANMWY